MPVGRMKRVSLFCILSPLLSSLIWAALLIELMGALIPYRTAFWIAAPIIAAYAFILARSFIAVIHAMDKSGYNVIALIVGITFNLFAIAMCMPFLRDLHRGYTNTMFP
jgi:hypothetical protein